MAFAVAVDSSQYYWNADSAPFSICQVVYQSAIGQTKLAVASSAVAGTAAAVGIVFDTSVAVGAQFRALSSGPMSATTQQWDAQTGQVGGLTPKAAYYLDPTTPGRIVTPAPIGLTKFIVYLGVADSSTVLDVSINVAAGPIVGAVLPGTTAMHAVILGDSQAYSIGAVLGVDDDLVTAFPNARITETIGSSDPFIADYTIADRALQSYDPTGSTGMSTALTMGRGLYQLGRTPVKISKWASRGSILGVAWQPATGSYWALITAFLDARVISYGPIGVVYLDLGSNDSQAFVNANSWAVNCANLITALRARYGNFTLGIRQTSQNLDPAYPYWAVTRAQQISYVAGDSNSFLIGADDCPLATDNLHLVSGMYGVIGYRASTEFAARLGPPSPFVGPFPQFIGTVQGVSSAGVITPLSYPAPTDIGGFFDVLVVATATVGSGKSAATLSEPAGFTLIGSQKSVAAGVEQWLTLFHRRVTSRHMGAPTVADANDINGAKIFTFWQPTTRAGAPYDVATFTANNAANPAISVAGVTTVTANSLVAVFAANYGGSPRTASGWANADLGAVTNVGFSDQTLLSGDHCVIFCTVGTKAVPGVVGATTGTANNYLVGAYCTMSIKP